MAVVGMVVHPERTRATECARTAADWLIERGNEVRLPIADAGWVGRPDLAVPVDEFALGLDLAVSVGGDGTMLRTMHLVAADDVPVLGINVGQLGYLTEVEPDAWHMALKRFLAGSYDIDRRMMVAVQVDAPSGVLGSVPVELGLNEAVLEKQALGHTVRLSVSIDGEFFTTYTADGLILATPTGSTAYSLSARGPVIDARHRALLLTPVSPHGLFDRSLVLDPSAVVRLEVFGSRPASLSVDGRHLGVLEVGDAIECTASERTARLVTFGAHNVHNILKTKFGLNDR